MKKEVFGVIGRGGVGEQSGTWRDIWNSFVSEAGHVPNMTLFRSQPRGAKSEAFTLSLTYCNDSWFTIEIVFGRVRKKSLNYSHFSHDSIHDILAKSVNNVCCFNLKNQLEFKSIQFHIYIPHATCWPCFCHISIWLHFPNTNLSLQKTPNPWNNAFQCLNCIIIIFHRSRKKRIFLGN